MKLEKADRRDKQQRRKKHGMRVSGKRRLELIIKAIKEKAIKHGA